MNQKIKNTGLKGKKEISERILNLMYLKESENPDNHKKDILVTKKGPNNKAYAIVKENQKYFIKVANLNKNGLLTENYDYIGGLSNKMDESYDSYSVASKYLKIKLLGIAKSKGLVYESNILSDDNLFEVGEDCVEDLDKVVESDLFEIEDLTEDNNDTNDEVIGDEFNLDSLNESIKDLDVKFNQIVNKKKSLG